MTPGGPSTDGADPTVWLDALSASHRSLTSLVEGLAGDDLHHPSYCDEWSIAQVLSHLGSGAEIFGMVLDAVLAGEEPPSREELPAVWDRWDAKTPAAQAADFVAADRRLVASLEKAGDALARLQLTLFGSMTVDGAGFVAMRLNEHALHSWDAAVAFDASARVAPDAVDLLVGRLPRAGRVGHAEGAGDDRPFAATVLTTDSGRAFAVEVDDAVTVRETTGSAAGGDLHLPAEAALRLVYGRLDHEHRPPAAASELAVLRRLQAVFTGF